MVVSRMCYFSETAVTEHDKTRWLKQRKSECPGGWKLEVKGSVGLISLGRSVLGDGGLLAMTLRGLSSVSACLQCLHVQTSYKDTSLI